MMSWGARPEAQNPEGWWRFLGSGVLALTLAGCAVLAPGDDEELGVIHFHGDSTTVALPSSVAVDSTFSVRFHTFGGGCISFGRTEVLLKDDEARITPIDRNTGAEVCTAELQLLEHRADVAFRTPGTATVVVRGRVEPGGAVVELLFLVSVVDR